MTMTEQRPASRAIPPEEQHGGHGSRAIRQAFERWVAEHYDFESDDMKRDTPQAEYRNVTVRIAWQAWLAARRHYKGEQK